MGNNVIYFVDITKHTLQLYFTVPAEEILKERSYPKLNRNSYILCHAMDFSLIFSYLSFFSFRFLFLTPKRMCCFLIFLVKSREFKRLHLPKFKAVTWKVVSFSQLCCFAVSIATFSFCCFFLLNTHKSQVNLTRSHLLSTCCEKGSWET